jgi:hypothetical protein
MGSVSAIVGSIMVTESLLSVLDKQWMSHAFEPIAASLKKVCDFFVDKFIEARN